MERKRIVVKIGSSSLTNAKGEIDKVRLMDHVQAIAELKKQGHEVLLVSSGAVAAGFKQLGYPARPVTVKGKQAAAAVGQSLLIQTYSALFSIYDITPAQILLTRTDFSKKECYKNAYATFEELLERSMLPIINENDTVSISELTFGDNDMLSALVSGLVHADQLIILTDINGLYNANPAKNPQAERIDRLTAITDDMLSFADGTGSKVGTGGMAFIGTGQGAHKLLAILAGHGDGTYVEHDELAILTNHKQWIALTEVSGKIFIDSGAEKALMDNGKSLLPAGVYRVEGDFDNGDVVEVYSEQGLLGRGEVLYSSLELTVAMGKRTDTLSKCPIEVIHRDKWLKIQTNEGGMTNDK